MIKTRQRENNRIKPNPAKIAIIGIRGVRNLSSNLNKKKNNIEYAIINSEKSQNIFLFLRKAKSKTKMDIKANIGSANKSGDKNLNGLASNPNSDFSPNKDIFPPKPMLAG